jgi:hypothetical protein
VLRSTHLLLCCLWCAGCAVAWRSNDEIKQLGFAWTREGKSSCGEFVERTVPGLDLRIRTGDSGLALGWSRQLLARPGKRPDGTTAPCWRYPREARTKRPYLLPYRTLGLPRERDEAGRRLPSFVASTTAGLSLQSSEIRKGLSLLWERSSVTAADPHGDSVCQLRYFTSLSAAGELGSDPALQDALDLFFFVER